MILTKTSDTNAHQDWYTNTNVKGASSTVEDEKEKSTTGGYPKIWVPIVGKVNEGSSEEK